MLIDGTASDRKPANIKEHVCSVRTGFLINIEHEASTMRCILQRERYCTWYRFSYGGTTDRDHDDIVENKVLVGGQMPVD